MFAYFTIYLVAALFCGSLAIALAHVKHRTWVLWGSLCFFFPPLVVALLLLPKRAGPAPHEREFGDIDYDREDRGWFF